MNALFYGCYDFNEEWLLIELLVDGTCDDIDWGEIVIPEDGVCPADWQCAYLEQYLNADGTERICDLYDEPDEATAPCRVAFFLYKVGMPIVHTPFGDFDLTNPQNVPDRLIGVVELDCEDEED